MLVFRIRFFFRISWKSILLSFEGEKTSFPFLEDKNNSFWKLKPKVLLEENKKWKKVYQMEKENVHLFSTGAEVSCFYFLDKFRLKFDCTFQKKKKKNCSINED